MEFKNKLSLKEFEVSNASCSNLAGNYHGEKKTFDVKQMSSNLRVKIVSLNKFDLGGTKAPHEREVINICLFRI